MSNQFNAIDYAQQLEAAGVPQAQADVHAKMLSLVLTDCAASKADLIALDDKLASRLDMFEERITTRMDAFETKISTRMDAFEAKISARMDAFEAKISARMNAFEAEITARADAFEARVKLDLAKMHAEIVALRGDLRLYKWMTGTNTAILIAVLVKLYFP